MCIRKKKKEKTCLLIRKVVKMCSGGALYQAGICVIPYGYRTCVCVPAVSITTNDRTTGLRNGS